MKAWRVHSPNNVSLDEMESLPVSDDCVKIKLLTSGLSTSDISIYKGDIPAQYPVILGRQAVGFVSEIGANVKTLTRGNRVVIYPCASCNTCQPCRIGKPYDCDNPAVFGVSEDGFLRDFAVVSSSDVYLIPERLNEKDAIFTEHTAMAINTLLKLGVQKGDHVVIIGATVTGIITAQVAIYYQAVPIIVDMQADKLDLASKLGVYYTINSVNQDAYKKIFALTGSRMADSVIYSMFSSMPVAPGLDYVKSGGKMALVGQKNIKNEINMNLSAFVDKDLSLLTITDCGKNYSAAINMLANKTVQVAPLISTETPFSSAGEQIKKEADICDKYHKTIITY